jgi:hypothetical protein
MLGPTQQVEGSHARAARGSDCACVNSHHIHIGCQCHACSMRIGMKTDVNGQQTPQSFPFSYFIMRSGSGSGIARNGSGIYGLRK